MRQKQNTAKYANIFFFLRRKKSVTKYKHPFIQLPSRICPNRISIFLISFYFFLFAFSFCPTKIHFVYVSPYTNVCNKIKVKRYLQVHRKII